VIKRFINSILLFNEFSWGVGWIHDIYSLQFNIGEVLIQEKLLEQQIEIVEATKLR